MAGAWRKAVLIGTAAALAALAGCGPRGGATQPPAQSPATTAQALDPAATASVFADLDPCANGASAFARNICNNHDLAALDAQARQALTQVSASLSQPGAELLAQNQRQWRDAQSIACGMLNPSAQPTQAQRTCLNAQFNLRLAQARTAVQRIGGYVFQRVENVAAAPPAGGGSGDASDAVVRNIRFPRMDGDSPQAQRFNALVAQQPQYRIQDGASETVDYRIVYAGPALVSIRFDSDESSPNEAHPNHSSKAVNVLMASGRLLQPTDVFRAGSGWEDFLTRRAVRDLTRRFSDYQFTPADADVRETATKPHLWLITERGLTMLFPPYSFGAPYDYGGAEVTIAWADLRPYLSPNAPAPIRAAA